MPLQKDNIGLILLGASDFPLAKSYNGSIAFSNAKTRIHKYFADNYFSGNDLVLDLFDSEDEQSVMLDKIGGFIQDVKGKVEDLFIYYVGHGGYDNKAGFLMAIKKSRERSLGSSSLVSQHLGSIISREADSLRLFLILDCCFAADFASLESPVLTVLQKEISDHFPENGIAMLCSSSKDKPSVIIEDRQITMFSESLDLALQKGHPDTKKEYLTLRELGNLTYSYIKEMNPGKEIRPEVHTPEMPDGDIADLPHFPNKRFGFDVLTDAYDINARDKEIQDAIMINNVQSANKLFIGFVNDFDKTQVYRIDATLLISEIHELEENKPPRQSDEYEKYKKARVQAYRQILELIVKIKKTANN